SPRPDDRTARPGQKYPVLLRAKKMQRAPVTFDMLRFSRASPARQRPLNLGAARSRSTAARTGAAPQYGMRYMSERQAPSRVGRVVSAALHQNVWDFADLTLKLRFAQALEDGSTRYPVHRSVRFAARVELEALFDDLALGLGWRAQRLDSRSLL